MFDYEADIFNFRYYPHKRDTQKEKKLRSCHLPITKIFMAHEKMEICC